MDEEELQLETNKKNNSNKKIEEIDENFEGRKKFINPNDSKIDKERKNDLRKELSAAKVLQKFINKDDPQVKTFLNFNNLMNSFQNKGKYKISGNC